MSLKRPAVYNLCWSSGMTQPSVIGHAMPRRRRPASTTFSDGSARSSFSDPAPAVLAISAPETSASASERMFSPGDGDLLTGPNEPPLCEIAPWKSPLARGEAHSMLTAMPPADSPKIVTLFGSPPRAAMLRSIHRRPATMSSRP